MEAVTFAPDCKVRVGITYIREEAFALPVDFDTNGYGISQNSAIAIRN